MFRILPHLPLYGPLATPFPADGQGSHREGYVVEFEPSRGDKWGGNFQKGMTSFSAVFGGLGKDVAFVVAGGAGYKVEVISKVCLGEIGSSIDWCLELPDQSAIVLSYGVAFEAIDKNGRIWYSDRISWDGFSDLSYSAGKIYGKAYSPVDDSHHQFELNLTDGTFVGGAFNEFKASLE